MADASDAVLKTFREAGALLEGHFLLTSGFHSPKYLQCALVLQRPAQAERLCGQLAARFRGRGVTCVVGPAIGGILVAHEVARALGTKCLFAERQEGAMTLRRGFAVGPEDCVVLVEDVVTTGGSLREVADLVRAAGAQVVGVGALVDRTSGRDPAFGAPLEALVAVEVPTYAPSECPLCRQGLPLVKPGSRQTPGKEK
jgi:orotate phosphoribosyltransferase